ncbi:protein ORF20A [Pigeon adenovirus 2]|uniref:Protein ORF20A n=1 Tax=Pigeon adenovirus 2 TaxID=1907767 RepID=A0A1D8QMA6_9ADEN|nr:protein ORF20A [Pigeon adenovirus 2]AOW42064.1 protein ORF20A [Pigeon adenovirus 2]
MPLCPSSVMIVAGFVVLAVSLIYVAFVTCSYLFLKDLLSELSFCLITLFALTFTSTIATILSIRLTTSRRLDRSKIRSRTRFPRSCTVSANPIYSPVLHLVNRQLPAAPPSYPSDSDHPYENP